MPPVRNVPSNLKSDISSEVYDFCRKTELQKRDRDCFASLALDHYRGNMWTIYDPLSYTVRADPELLNGGMMINQSAGIEDAIIATILASALVPEGVPSSSSASDARSAQVVTAILDDHRRRNHGDRTLRMVLQECVPAGDSFKRVSFDPKQLGTITLTPEQMVMFTRKTGILPDKYSQTPDGKIRAEVPIGGTVETQVSASSVLVETGTQRWEDVARFAVVEYMPVTQAKSLFPNMAQAIEAMSVWDKREFGYEAGTMIGSWSAGSIMYNQQTGYQFDQSAGMVRLLEFWERMSNGAWQRGVFTGDQLQYQIEQQTSSINPYIRYCYKPLPNFFWSKGAYRDMYRVQRIINKVAHRAMTHLVQSVKDMLFLPFDATIEATNEDCVVVRYSAMTQALPVYRPVDPTMWQYLSQVLGEFRDLLNMLGQVSSVARGDLPDRSSGAAIAREIEVNSGPFLQVRADIIESELETYRKVVTIAQSMYSLERLAPLLGDYGDVNIQEFSASDVMAGTGVQIVESEKSPQSRAQRLQLILGMIKEGLALPQAGDALKQTVRFVNSAGIESSRPEEDVLNERIAAMHYDWICQGTVFQGPPETIPDPNDPTGQYIPPQIRPGKLLHEFTMDNGLPGIEPLLYDYYNHQIQADQNVKDLLRPGITQQARALMQTLLGEHMAAIQMAAQQAQADQIRGLALQSTAQAEGQGKNIILAAKMDVAKTHATAGLDAKPEDGSGSSPSTKSSASGGQKTSLTGANHGVGKYGATAAAP